MMMNQFAVRLVCFWIHTVFSATFASADQFLNSVLKHAPACLILDVHMAGMDGFALQQKLKANGSRLPIIFISAIKLLNSQSSI